MSRKHGGIDIIGVIGTLLAMVLTTGLWVCDQLIPVAIIEPRAEACGIERVRMAPVYDDVLDGGLGECTMVEVWTVSPEGR